MILFDKFELENGLKVIFHKDKTTPIVAVNILYNVGAKDEAPDKTGFAHLFEHLMFGGSKHIPVYDEPLERVGGENNAFTTNDITNYYLTLPKQNIETAFWLESDRMNELAFSLKSLEVQRKVVINEFKQSYLNQPYGDVWLLLRPLAYKVHPYQWNTIGKDISHIKDAKIKDVKSFFKQFYCPNNAIMVVGGNIELDDVKNLSEKWFGNIKKGDFVHPTLTPEPLQTEHRTLTVKRKVPFDAIYKVYHMCGRSEPNFHATNLITDVLSNGNSSRLFVRLVKEKKLFSSIDAYHFEHLEKGLLCISGKLVKGVQMNEAENAIQEEIEKMKNETVGENELEKVKNKIEAENAFSEINILHKAMNLAYSELLGDAALINQENEKYRNVKAEDIKRISNKILKDSNCSTLYYLSKK